MTGSRIIEEADALLAAGHTDAAIRRVTDAAESGDSDALNQLALWRVYGDPLPRDFAEARMLFGRAGARGHGGGAISHAVFVALGAGQAPDWGDALRLLGEAAAWEPRAARQLDLIAAMPLDGEGRPRKRPALEPIALAPRLAIARALFTPEECAHVRELAAPLLAPSVVVDSRTGRQAPHPIRTSDGTVLGPIQQDLAIHALNQRLAAASGTRVEQGEPLSVLRYRPGQQYRLHHDCLPNEPNQRLLTAIVYLNGGYAGGATAFPAIGREIAGAIGDAILFGNVRTDGAPDEASRHAGLPIERGEKWICTRWIRAHDFDPWGLRNRRKAR